MNIFPRIAALSPRINPDWAKLPLFDRSKWQRVRFGDVVENVNETERDPAAAGIERFIAMEHLEPGSLHISSWGNVADGTTFNRRCRPGQVLFGKRRAYQRKVAVAEFDAVVSGDIYVFAPKGARLLPELLPFICTSELFFEHAVGTSAGSLSPRTNWISLANYEFDLPSPAHQRRIADLLLAFEASDSAYSLANKAIDDLRQAAVDDVLNGRGFEQIHVGSIAKFTSGKTISVSDLASERSANCSIPVFGGNGISGYTDTPLITEPNVVVGRVGQFCGVVHMTSGPSWITDNALMLASNDPKIERRFLALCLAGRKINRQKIGNYLPLINQRVVHEVSIPMPPLDVQEEILQEVNSIIHTSASVQNQLDTLRLLRQKFVNELVAG